MYLKKHQSLMHVTDLAQRQASSRAFRCTQKETMMPHPAGAKSHEDQTGKHVLTSPSERNRGEGYQAAAPSCSACSAFPLDVEARTKRAERSQ